MSNMYFFAARFLKINSEWFYDFLALISRLKSRKIYRFESKQYLLNFRNESPNFVRRKIHSQTVESNTMRTTLEHVEYAESEGAPKTRFLSEVTKFNPDRQKLLCKRVITNFIKSKTDTDD